MRFASLGSGSAGNCMVIEQASTRLLLDCGFGANEATTMPKVHLSWRQNIKFLFG
jgi:phosphoribosyl 1,2-cyclic phosphodiesterase